MPICIVTIVMIIANMESKEIYPGAGFEQQTSRTTSSYGDHYTMPPPPNENSAKTENCDTRAK